MMQASGTAEGLRNVIDSSLTKSLDQIFRNFAKVGSPVLALGASMGPACCLLDFQLNLLSEAINLTATFVHNEPTSLAVIQEMKLHESLYDAMEFNAKPSFDVSSAVTQ
jgi:E3 ubiquitin-protein ligase HUWE1